MAGHVRITDVAPRDGLQNEATLVPTAAKARLVQALCATGVDEIEVTSFVSPKWIPQLGDAAELCALVDQCKPRGILYSALVPNERGMERLLEVNATRPAPLIDKASVFTAASESFSQRNTNASIAQTIERFVPVVALAKANGLLTRGYISCVIGCPFEGPIKPEAVARIASELNQLGFDEIDLGDTIGKGTPETIRAMLDAVLTVIPADRLVLHLHDTFGAAASCVAPALELGVRSFDAAAGGLGGCPYASTPTSRAPGNIATSALVRAIHAAGLDSRIDEEALEVASSIARDIVAEPGGATKGGAG